MNPVQDMGGAELDQLVRWRRDTAELVLETGRRVTMWPGRTGCKGPRQW